MPCNFTEVRRVRHRATAELSSIEKLLHKQDLIAALRVLGNASTEFVTRGQAITILGVSVRSIINYETRGWLKPYRIRGSRPVRYRRHDVIALLEPVPVKKAATASR
jgi:hypothetical protein